MLRYPLHKNQARYNISSFRFSKFASISLTVAKLCIVPFFANWKYGRPKMRQIINETHDSQGEVYGQILQGLYFQIRKEFAAYFYCTFILSINEHLLWLWAKSDEVRPFCCCCCCFLFKNVDFKGFWYFGSHLGFCHRNQNCHLAYFKDNQSLSLKITTALVEKRFMTCEDPL